MQTSYISFLCVACFIFAGCSDLPPDQTKNSRLTIHAATSLTDLVQAAGALFSETYGVELEYNFSSSGALAQQLIAAPRGDLFISANLEWMERTITEGQIDPASTRALLGNQLVLLTNTDNRLELTSPTALCESDLRIFSIGDPTYVPAGHYARQWLQSIPCGSQTLWEKVQPHIVPAIDARAALNQLRSSRDAVGIVYLTDYLANPEQLDLIHTVPASEGPSIHYKAGILSNSDQKDIATDFLDFFISTQGQQLIEQHGFLPVTNRE